MDPMEAIRRTFFLECEEGLSDLEAGLLRMEAGETDGETVNAVFRAVHSIKGGAGAFSLDALVRFAHAFETTLDDVRSDRLAADATVVAVLLRANAFARVAVCGMIAGYDGQPLPLQNPALILVNRMKVQGFIVSEHMEIWPEALKELGGLVGSGKLRPRETVAEGIAAAPEAFLGLLKGKNFGKQLVKLV